MSDRKNFPPDHFPRLRRNARITFVVLGLIVLGLFLLTALR